MVASPWTTKYIPTGCIDISFHDIHLEPEHHNQLKQWHELSHPLADPADGAVRVLPSAVQTALLRSKDLRPFVSLWKSRWIHLSVRTLSTSQDITGILRVHVLPFDVGRNIVSHRDDQKLAKSLATLLRCLDYSVEAWNGHLNPQKLSQPRPVDAATAPGPEDSSLLAMFNSVPSPDPQPAAISDPDARNAMVSVLESNLPGLRTTLYPYQCRSAALMLQRELVPGRVVDPRLRACRDQDGHNWYYDSVTGLVLREPRYYDGTRGGILAEEMGAGKTLICLALILSTLREPTSAPEPFVPETPARRRMGSLADMCAATANRRSVAWQPYFDYIKTQFGQDHEQCIKALRDPANRAFYRVRSDPLVEPRRSSRLVPRELPTKEIHLGSGTLIVVPDNLVTQWKEEIKKHTNGLQVLTLVNRDPMPCVAELMAYDIVLISQGRLEWIWGERRNGEGPTLDISCPLEHIQWKRSIVDEGHKLGSRSKSSMMLVLDQLNISAKWIVTGTPTRNLYGVKGAIVENEARQLNDVESQRNDLVHIGKMASKYLGIRPWANTRDDAGDTVADWNVYVMNSAQHSKGQNRVDTLKSTLNSLIIRHRLADISRLLPAVDEKFVYLEGSYQDKMALNLFSMVIILNAVQSQRTDVDYLFHPRQKKSLLELVRNLRQACFFGGVFFSAEDIQKSLEIAETFMKEKKVPISAQDEVAMQQAIDFGHVAIKNRLKNVSNRFHSCPLYLEHFPGGHGKSWSLDDFEDGPICIDAGLVLALQKYLNPCIDAPTSLQMMIDSGRLDLEGQTVRQKALEAAEADGAQARNQGQQSTTLAGQTQMGSDRHAKPKSGLLDKSAVITLDDDLTDSKPKQDTSNITVADSLASTRIVSTVSAKLSYLIDAIVQHKDDEQIIVFYDNDNIAWYLAGVLEILQIEHLIYTRAGLSAERRAQYVATFTHNPKFRVLLMDISQAAFGLDMRSASRIYFLSPVLNPQVQAQAVGRARRISQQRPVTVETLVLKDSIEEVIVDRGKKMTQAEHRKVMSSVIEDKPINDWIRNVSILPMTRSEEETGGSWSSQQPEDGLPQTALLETPQYVFGRGFGREFHPDEGLIMNNNSPEGNKSTVPVTGDDAMGKQGGRSSLPVRVPFKLRVAGATTRKSESPMTTASSTRETTPMSISSSSSSVTAGASKNNSNNNNNNRRQHSISGSTEERPKKKVRVVAWADE